MMLTFDYLQFILAIRKNANEEISSEITYDIIGTFEAVSYPMNVYTELISKEINPQRGSTPLRDKLIKSLTKWTEILSKFLADAVKKVKFPELCHYCPPPPFLK